MVIGNVHCKERHFIFQLSSGCIHDKDDIRYFIFLFVSLSTIFLAALFISLIEIVLFENLTTIDEHAKYLTVCTISCSTRLLLHVKRAAPFQHKDDYPDLCLGSRYKGKVVALLAYFMIWMLIRVFLYIESGPLLKYCQSLVLSHDVNVGRETPVSLRRNQLIKSHLIRLCIGCMIWSMTQFGGIQNTKHVVVW